jgi:FKBP-type peptidyl-prolyl cis-trans isomerase FkpA
VRSLVRTICVCLAVAAATLGISGCAESPTSPSNFAPYSQTDLVVGTGGDAVNGKVLFVKYTGWYYNQQATDHKGVQFDSSATSGGDFSFTLGSAQVIEGWDKGVLGMRVGGTRRLVIPPSLAYGGSRSGPIPPNATLLFEIQLIAIQDDATTTTN